MFVLLPLVNEYSQNDECDGIFIVNYKVVILMYILLSAYINIFQEHVFHNQSNAMQFSQPTSN